MAEWVEIGFSFCRSRTLEENGLSFRILFPRFIVIGFLKEESEKNYMGL